MEKPGRNEEAKTQNKPHARAATLTTGRTTQRPASGQRTRNVPRGRGAVEDRALPACPCRPHPWSPQRASCASLRDTTPERGGLREAAGRREAVQLCRMASAPAWGEKGRCFKLTARHQRRGTPQDHADPRALSLARSASLTRAAPSATWPAPVPRDPWRPCWGRGHLARETSRSEARGRPRDPGSPVDREVLGSLQVAGAQQWSCCPSSGEIKPTWMQGKDRAPGTRLPE